MHDKCATVVGNRFFNKTTNCYVVVVNTAIIETQKPHQLCIIIHIFIFGKIVSFLIPGKYNFLSYAHATPLFHVGILF